MKQCIFSWPCGDAITHSLHRWSTSDATVIWGKGNGGNLAPSKATFPVCAIDAVGQKQFIYRLIPALLLITCCGTHCHLSNIIVFSTQLLTHIHELEWVSATSYWRFSTAFKAAKVDPPAAVYCKWHDSWRTTSPRRIWQTCCSSCSTRCLHSAMLGINHAAAFNCVCHPAVLTVPALLLYSSWTL